MLQELADVLNRNHVVVDEIGSTDEFGNIEIRIKGRTPSAYLTCLNPTPYQPPASIRDALETVNQQYYGFRGAYNTRIPAIKNVVFNDPATIVIWADGTKTVVKTQNGEEFDPEKGLAMAITKKAFGNQGNYYETIKKWVEKYEPVVTEGNPLIKHADEIQKSFRDIILNAGKEGSE